MKIVELRFENLNSLVGRWQIDLSQPEFVSDGIFAITGPTGAGKTTILDAVCVALYGSTPRLGRLAKGSNELMSRQTGHCFAQVTFETRTGRYVSQWSQHRARKKPGAELQAPRHEISDATSGKILSSSVKESAALVVELTGMSFEQFTRSMMLAQGAFAAFLQAKSDERAPILEQITGTEIYSEISVLVHQYRGEQERRLTALKQQLDGRAVLSEQARAALQQQFDALQTQVQTWQQAQHQARQQLQTRQQLDANARHLQVLATKQQAHEQHSAVFEPDRQRLLWSRRTLEVAPDYRALTLLRQEQASDQASLQQLQQQQPAREAQVAQAQLRVEALESHSQQQRREWERMQPVLEQARALDVQMAQQRSVLSTQATQAQSLATQQQHLDAESLRLTQQKALAVRDLADLEQQVQQRHRDASLPETLSGLVHGLDRWVELDQSVARLTLQQQTLTQRVAATRQKAESSHARWQQAVQQQQALQNEVQQHEQALASCLQGRRLLDWQHQQAEWLTRRQVCQQAQENWRQSALLTTALAANRQKIGDLCHRTEQLDLTIAQLQREQVLQQTHIESLRQQEALQRRIENYEQARAHLHEGEPCPLCGALEHPFAEGVTSAMDHVQQQLRAAQAALTRLEQALSAQQVERANVNFQCQTVEQQRQEQQIAWQQCQSAQPALLAALGVTQVPVQQTLETVLEAVAVQVASQLQSVQQLLAHADQHASALHRAQQAVQQVAQSAQQLQAQWHVAQQQADQETLQLAQAQQSLSDLCQQRDSLAQKLLQQLVSYGDVTATAFTHREQVLQLKVTLTQRRDAWLRLQAALVQAQQVLPSLEQSLQHLHVQRQAKDEEWRALVQSQQQLQQQIMQTQEQRQALLADESPIEVGRRLSHLLEQTRTSLDQSRVDLNQAQMALQQLLDRQLTLRDRIAQRAQRVMQQQVTLQGWMTQHGFADEAALQAAMLTDQERQALELQERQLFEARSALEAEYATVWQAQQHLLADAEGLLSVEEITEQLRRVEVQLSQAMEMLGSVRQRMTDDDRAKQESVSLWEQVQQQQREFEKWNTLHSLIGSADGKKFRTFAQGLTFEVVIQHANRQLQRMTDRYVLVRGTSEPLELNVVDQYQAGEVRSTKNLSGGESFLVSLALALGLSNMASRKIRVDSLFLDEGFGTLDEDALDMALQTLSTLHQEGKLIGVISHVQALKDRIATQIQVAPVRGGRSVLQGPGCTRLALEDV